MPYIHWADYGICKFFMAQKCAKRSKCKYRHPDDWKEILEDDSRWQEVRGAMRSAPAHNRTALDGEPSITEGKAMTRSPTINDHQMHGQPQFSSEKPYVGWQSTAEAPEREQRAPGTAKMVASNTTELANTANEANENVNFEPLGRPNRLACRERDTEISTCRPLSVWKRSDPRVTETNPPAMDDEPRDGKYWEQFRARRMGQNTKRFEKSPVTMGEEERMDVVESSSFQPRPVSLWGQQSAAARNLPPSLAAESSSIPTSHKSHTHGAGGSLKMGTKRMANGEAKHPPRSEIRVSARYVTQAAIDKQMRPPPNENVSSVQERSFFEAREDNVRLQGVSWIDNVRRALEMPIRTYTTACTYYHKLRLAHPGLLHGTDPNVQATITDACAASLLTACKVEDTLKKSRDILAAAYNLKAPAQEQLGPDDSIFEGPAKNVMVLERMVLEAGGFDFRSKHPHILLVKVVKSMALAEGNEEARKQLARVAWTVLTDLHRTFAPLKQTAATMALASLELAAHLIAASSPNNTSVVRDAIQAYDISFLSATREEVMETLLDLLDLYTHHTTATALGSTYSLDDFLRIRLAMNKECAEFNLPRFTTGPPRVDERPVNGSTSRVANGHPTPISPTQADPQPQSSTQAPSQSNKPATDEPIQTYRFMLNPQQAADEKMEVQKYFTEEWEEYEEEVEVPISRPRSQDRRDPERGGRSDAARPPRPVREDRERERDRLRDRERELERERARLRERERGPPRRYDERESRRFEEKRDSRRYEDDRRRRDDRR